MQPLSILELMFTLHELLWCHMVHSCFIYLGVDELQLREDWWRRHSTLSVHATAWTLAAWTAWTELRYHSGQHDKPTSGQVHVWHNIYIYVYYMHIYIIIGISPPPSKSGCWKEASTKSVCTKMAQVRWVLENGDTIKKQYSLNSYICVGAEALVQLQHADIDNSMNIIQRHIKWSAEDHCRHCGAKYVGREGAFGTCSLDFLLRVGITTNDLLISDRVLWWLTWFQGYVHDQFYISSMEFVT